MKKLFLFQIFLLLTIAGWSQTKPSLIPLPQQLKWNNGSFDLRTCKLILIVDNQLSEEAKLLQSKIKSVGINVPVKRNTTSHESYIELRIEKFESPSSEEAYKLSVNARRVVISANTSHGIFNGIQTFLQLLKRGTKAVACDISDRPAFSWRGYMIDVGRNFMSMDLLKQQIDIMAMYKLNVFHFHATEDIAWRIAIKQYPQLTAAENMIRNKGFYSEADIKELIEYCRQRHIIFVPEIDMPGHSAAFKRAMKTDMQSDSGMQYVKNILNEFCAIYDVPYIHIGADEVKITNKNFIPEVTAYIESLGKKVIGWQPGGNFSDNTIRQLWMDDNAHLSANTNIQYIDSRHLYLNHMDPLEAVATIFNRKIGNKDKTDNTTLGGTICMWHDRAVAKEDDILRMNPVYPGMLAFAERSWKGGEQQGWIANISDGDKVSFIEFENRLLDNKQLYFKDKSFPYVKQSNIEWKLFGPYDNEADLSKIFEPELKSWDESKSKFAKQVTGGTIVLRHWWAPLIKGAIDDPKENTTWYAVTKIWSDKDKTQPVWIGFNNLSRSPATDSPQAGEWDGKQSSVWVNRKLIAPPVWKRGGQKGNSEIPLIDEGYEYREPANVLLKKGWNTILIKCPVGTFKGKDWQNPIKWMFTFAPFQ